ncbi:phospholipase A1-IIgamma-like [Impatiens glandulifera]|uniref:phospholipase A1-IIgamma-like n=1 Tax=Impatiens glandulifera TaxID=253017 RepID=UPI001FB11F8F|nr:phospholipase A1-IIgamma-like [Impatiens glandulifera]
MENWKLLSGDQDWEGLLEPLDYDLRRYLIHYGEMAEATYDAFNANKASKFAGLCRYSMDELFSKVGLGKGKAEKKYRVTKYLYATSSSLIPNGFLLKSLSREDKNFESNWIGYVAVATDEGAVEMGRRDIVVAWRGTIESMEWINDVQFGLIEATPIFKKEGDGDDTKEEIPNVHEGFYSLYTSTDPMSKYNKTSVRDQVLEEITRLVNTYENEELSITVTGHSLGAAITTLNAIDIARNAAQNHRVTAFPFACPRVGDSSLNSVASNLHNLHILRIENIPDVVPDHPIKLVGYDLVGKVLKIDSQKSPYLKNDQPGLIFFLKRAHNLEVYLHTVSGTQGSEEEFKLVIDRDIALVNKGLDGLKEEYGVPALWWVQANHGMTQLPNGSWELVDTGY